MRIHQGQLWANTARDKDYDNKLCFLLFQSDLNVYSSFKKMLRSQEGIPLEYSVTKLQLTWTLLTSAVINGTNIPSLLFISQLQLYSICKNYIFVKSVLITKNNDILVFFLVDVLACTAGWAELASSSDFSSSDVLNLCSAEKRPMFPFIS